MSEARAGQNNGCEPWVIDMNGKPRRDKMRFSRFQLERLI
jgi:hypothetical protein